jgi:hypothetical protein
LFYMSNAVAVSVVCECDVHPPPSQADNVWLDLNGNTLSMSPVMSLKQRFFSLIQLSSRVFEALDGQNSINVLVCPIASGLVVHAVHVSAVVWIQPHDQTGAHRESTCVYVSGRLVGQRPAGRPRQGPYREVFRGHRFTGQWRVWLLWPLAWWRAHMTRPFA